jgi:hypothetical protein
MRRLPSHPSSLLIAQASGNDISTSQQKKLKEVCDLRGLSYFLSTDPSFFNYEGREGQGLRLKKTGGSPSKKAQQRRDKLPKMTNNWAAAGEEDEDAKRRSAMRDAVGMGQQLDPIEVNPLDGPPVGQLDQS